MQRETQHILVLAAAAAIAGMSSLSARGAVLPAGPWPAAHTDRAAPPPASRPMHAVADRPTRHDRSDELPRFDPDAVCAVDSVEPSWPQALRFSTTGYRSDRS